MPADVNLNIDVSKGGKGDEEAAVGLETVAKAADNATDQLKQLDRKLLETRAAMVGAGKTFQETGDISPLKSLLKDERQLSTVQKSITRGAEAIARDLGNAGDQGGQGFVSRFTSKIQSGIASLPPPEGLTQWLVLGAVAAAPAIGAAINAGVLLGVGGGALTLGIIGAVQDPRVKAAFAGLGEDAKSGLSDVSSSFVAPLERAAQRFQSTLNSDVFPGLRQDFDALAPSIDRLSAGVSGFAHDVMPGLNASIQASAPVLNELADDLPRLGQGISFFLDQMSKGGPGATAAIQNITTGLDSILASSGVAIRGLSMVYAYTNTLGGIMNVLSGSNDKAKTSFQLLTPPITAAATAAHAAVFEEQQLAAAVQHANDLLTKGIGANTTMAQTNDQVASSFQAVKDALANGAHSLDVHTAAGRMNRETILAGVEALKQQRQSAIDAAGGVNASKDAVDAANQKYDAGIGVLRGLASKMDAAGVKADDLSKALESIPNIVRSVTIDYLVNTTHKTTYIGGPSPYQQSANALLGAGALGGIRAYASGGIDQMAGFLKATNPGTLLAAEPRTGGEALIPKLGISDQRGLELANVAARWHGGRVVSGGGGRYGGASMAPAGGTKITVKLVTSADGGGTSADQAIASLIHYAVRAGIIQLRADASSGGQVRVG